MSRADRLAARLSERSCDLLLVTEPTNVRYVTGFTGSNGIALLGADVRRFLTDFRYLEQAAEEVPDFDHEQVTDGDLLLGLAARWPHGAARVGFDDGHLPVKRYGALRERLPDDVELVAAAGLVEEVRAVKEPGELDAIRAAAALADEVYVLLAETGLVGRTEHDVAVTIEHELRLRGAEGPSFPPIVAAAEHGALPHARPRPVPIPAGTLVTLDLGARLDGYCSDCTRTWATGPLDPEDEQLYELVRRAQEAGLAAVRPGPTGREVDAVARGVIEDAGHGERFGHGLGHGVGLDVHEAPRLSRQSDTRLRAGHVVTVEPGVYVPGRTGVRIEDLVVVTESGHEVVSSFPKSLVTVS